LERTVGLMRLVKNGRGVSPLGNWSHKEATALTTPSLVLFVLNEAKKTIFLRESDGGILKDDEQAEKQVCQIISSGLKKN